MGTSKATPAATTLPTPTPPTPASAAAPVRSRGRAGSCRGSGKPRGDHLPRAIQQRNARIERYRSLVRPIALHYYHCSAEPLDDLLQVGLLGLLRAAELYAPTTGTPFIAYARPHVRGAILHYLRDHATTVRLPRRLQEWQLQLQRWQEQHPGAGDACFDGATAERCRRQLGLSCDQWQRLMAARLLRHPLSLDAPRAPEGENAADPIETSSLEEDSAQTVESSEAEAMEAAASDRGRALALLDQLPAEQRLVVERVVLRGWSYRRLAEALQVSPMTIQRRLQRGLAQLRRVLQP